MGKTLKGKTSKGKTLKGKTSKGKIHNKRHRTKKQRHNNIQKGGGFSFTGVLASVLLSVGSVMGLKHTGMF